MSVLQTMNDHGKFLTHEAQKALQSALFETMFYGSEFKGSITKRFIFIADSSPDTIYKRRFRICVAKVLFSSSNCVIWLKLFICESDLCYRALDEQKPSLHVNKSFLTPSSSHSCPCLVRTGICFQFSRRNFLLLCSDMRIPWGLLFVCMHLFRKNAAIHISY